MSEITGYETEQIQHANDSGLTPVVFVHGLWLLPSSWDRWRTVFEEAGYTTVAPGWPDDPNSVDEANRNPEDDQAGRRSFRRCDRQTVEEARDHRALLRRTTHPDPGRARAIGGVGGHRPGTVSKWPTPR
jgi:hypothetical protein